ncbi:MAG: ATP-binding protein, partial [Lachnospiraceae bacterium]|nr:ATP-binding protein [Lachnospiraceae bacterium]
YEKYQPICREKKIRLQLNMPEDCFPIISSDRDRLCQIIEIFLDNAFTYSPGDSSITLSGEIEKNIITISVIDHGLGITENNKERIFDRFHQCDKSHTKKDHFGLGLSIAKELAENMNAHIHLSDTKGGGCTFSLSFNLTDK